MNQVHKEYKQPFLLEPTKLSRLVDIIHERLADHERTIAHDSFEAFLNGNRREEMGTLDQVLALDNSRSHKVERLVILCAASTVGSARPQHEIQVQFARPKSSGTGTSSSSKLVVVSVRSDASGWAHRTLSEIEEQIERTRLHYAQPIVVLCGLLLAILLLLGSTVRVETSAWGMWLKASDLDRIQVMLTQGRILTDESLREISTMQLRNFLDARRPSRSVHPNRTRGIVFLALPLVVVFACILVLVFTCYPRAVFLWGDEVDRHATTLQRRKAMWGIIVGIVAVGLLSRLFFEGIASWFPVQ